MIMWSVVLAMWNDGNAWMLCIRKSFWYFQQCCCWYRIQRYCWFGICRFRLGRSWGFCFGWFFLWMSSFDMPLQHIVSTESFSTVITSVWLLTSVNSHVNSACAWLSKWLIAVVAFVWSLTSMHTHMWP